MPTPTDPLARTHVVVVSAALAGMAVYAVSILISPGPGTDPILDGFLFHGVIGLSGIGCLIAARRRREMRAPWAILGTGLIVWAASDVILLAFGDDANPIFPSVPDAGFLATLFLFYLGAVYLARDLERRTSDYRWLDGAIAALGVSAIAFAVLSPAIDRETTLGAAAAAVNFTYPVADLLLVAMVVGVMVVNGQTASRTMLTVAAGFLLWASADTTYALEASAGTYEGGFVDLGWLGGAWLIALASLHAAEPDFATEEREARSLPAIPALAAGLAVALLVWDHFDSVDNVAIWLAAATLAAITVRQLLTSREIDLLVLRLRHDARTDPLTGLRNRRILFDDLDRAIAEGTRLHLEYTFALFDLNGFKSYNDTFGHPAGDQLLRRLGARLATVVGPTDGIYRLGGDEFCLLTAMGAAGRGELIDAARNALAETGEGFSIDASCGIVAIPSEASSSAQAFRLADDRMYSEKALRVDRTERSAHDVLLSALHERDAGLGDHLEQVGLLARRCAEELGLPLHEVEMIERAGELHDIGKIAVPERILSSPDPLDPDEQELMRRHTIVGQRILAAVPSLNGVGRLLRSAHERWDGRGYPDRLAAERIPLGARIIFVSDAFDAMTSERSYKSAVDVETALDELRRNAGTQFDPQVVAAFDRAVRRELSIPARGETGSAAVELPVEAERNVVRRLGAR